MFVAADGALTEEQLRLIRRGAELARRCAEPRSRDTTQARRDLAELLVDLREGFMDEKGRPDYLAGSPGYRRAAALLYDLSNLPAEDRERVRRGVKHHASETARRRLGPEGVARYGMSPVGKNESRAARHRGLT